MGRSPLPQPTEEQIRTIIYRYLKPRQYRVFLFGSRVAGTARKFSDYDIGIWGKRPLAPALKAEIEEALEESDLPYRVDVVDFTQVPEKFKAVASAQTKPL